MAIYNIFSDWKHVQGHTVKQKLRESVIEADSEDQAIEFFKERFPELAQHIKKREDGTWMYGSCSTFNSVNRVYAEILDI